MPDRFDLLTSLILVILSILFFTITSDECTRRGGVIVQSIANYACVGVSE